MPANRRTPWLVCYDIADPRRLGRVHRELSRHAVPLQYSVFYVHATRKKLIYLVNKVCEHIDSRYDDLRAYPLLAQADPLIYGRNLLPEGVTFVETMDMTAKVSDEVPKKFQGLEA